MTISLYLNGQNCQKVCYNKEDTFEQFVVDNADTIFGEKSVYIPLKHKIDNDALGGRIPDGVLFNLSNMGKPEFYLVEVELQSHDFRSHIYRQIDNFFDFFSNLRERNKLIEKIDTNINDHLRNKIQNLIGKKEIYRFLKDTINNNQNILIIIDGHKVEIEEKIQHRPETWGKWVKIQIIKHFKYDNQNIILTEPPFQNLEFGDAITTSNDIEKPDTNIYTEEFHLKDCNENVKNVYNKLKQSFLNIKNTIRFKPVKTYIGVSDRKNIAFLQFRKGKIIMLVIMPEDKIKNIITSKHHKVISHLDTFWHINKPNCDIEICDLEHFDEIESLLQKVVANNVES